MKKTNPDPIPGTETWARRAFLRAGLIVPAVLAASGALVPTPACADPDETPTPSAGEGPFFTPRSPERTTLLEPGLVGTPVDLTGRVLDTHGRPVPRALLDFWHADASGQYDTQSFRFRGHQYAGADGTFRLRTIVPGSYGPPRHYHVKLRAERGAVLTTQLLFPEDARTGGGRVDERLLMAVDDGRARFDFVLDLG